MERFDMRSKNRFARSNSKLISSIVSDLDK